MSTHVVDITPEGVKKDPERVNRAIEKVEAVKRSLLSEFFALFTEYQFAIREAVVAQDGEDGRYRELVESVNEYEEAYRELLKATAGRD